MTKLQPPLPGGDQSLSPSVDRTLRGLLTSLRAQRPQLTLERLHAARSAAAAQRLTDSDILRNGAFQLHTYHMSVPGGIIEMLVCRATAGRARQGVIYNIHGGGMVAGHNRTNELIGELDRAEALGLSVVAVNYRLAPEHPDPTPVEDCYAGLLWLAENEGMLGLDPSCIVVSGNSAGGGLAAGVALLARDRGGPPLRGQMLQCPMLDDRCDTPSAREMQNFGLWDTTSNRFGWTALLGTRRGSPDVSYYAAAARASDVSRLAPAYIDVGSAEALRDEAAEYALRIWRAGGDAELHIWAGAFHCFDQWAPDAVVSQAARYARLNWLQRVTA
jgi:acetyl esterase/lipase